MRDGYRLGLSNSRGVHKVDPTGEPERELTREYRQKASLVEDEGYNLLATTLRELAHHYCREANRVIDRYGELGEE